MGHYAAARPADFATSRATRSVQFTRAKGGSITGVFWGKLGQIHWTPAGRAAAGRPVEQRKPAALGGNAGRSTSGPPL